MICAILVAAGNSTRAGGNKILRELDGMPVLCHALCKFAMADEIIVVCKKDDEPHILPLLRSYPQARTCYGGDTRAESVLNALRVAKNNVVLVHDAARPFVSVETVNACIESVKNFGSGVCAVPATDTTVTVLWGTIADMPPRNTIYQLQTPQGLVRDKLLYAYEHALADGRLSDFTDDSGIYRAYVASPRIVLAERSNRKLTYPEDFTADRVGFGVDTHSFFVADEGAPLANFITLCGVKVPSQKILRAHSDGDVAVHALMDALLSAAGLYDIGHYFPDTDPAYRGADSMELLKRVMEMIAEKGYAPKNVSLSVLAETPRLAPHIDQMRESLASTLGLLKDAVAVAAGTNEKLGYVGEGKGITVFAYVSLMNS